MTQTLGYRLYMRSALWRARRCWWYVCSDRRCEDCGWPLVLHKRDIPRDRDPFRVARVLSVHHLTYRRLFRERREDVALLCWSCHCKRSPAGARAKRSRRDGGRS